MQIQCYLSLRRTLHSWPKMSGGRNLWSVKVTVNDISNVLTVANQKVGRVCNDFL